MSTSSNLFITATTILFHYQDNLTSMFQLLIYVCLLMFYLLMFYVLHGLSYFAFFILCSVEKKRGRIDCVDLLVGYGRLRSGSRSGTDFEHIQY
jgi:hypothetical protein